MKSFAGSVAIICLSFFATAQRVYSSADSARAKAYFKKCWDFPMTSLAHQAYLDSALMVIPTHAWYWQQKSMPLYKSQRYEIGKPYLDSAVRYDPDKWLDYRAFMKCIFERDYASSLREFHNCKAQFGGRHVMDHPYDFYMGLCHLQLMHFDSAATLFGRCVDNDVRTNGEKWVHYNHHFYLGVTLMEQGKSDAAVAYFDKALKSFPQFTEAQYYKAICLSRLDRKAEAATVMEAAWNNFQQGFGMTEDNAIYEQYPYQPRRAYVEGSFHAFSKEAKDTK